MAQSTEESFSFCSRADVPCTDTTPAQTADNTAGGGMNVCSAHAAASLGTTWGMSAQRVGGNVHSSECTPSTGRLLRRVADENSRWDRHSFGYLRTSWRDLSAQGWCSQAKGLRACSAQRSCQGGLGAATGLPWLKTVTKELTETQQHICDMSSACLSVTTCCCSTEQHRSRLWNKRKRQKWVLQTSCCRNNDVGQMLSYFCPLRPMLFKMSNSELYSIITY